MITWAQLGFQDANAPVIEEFIYFHDFTITILVVILRFVRVAMARSPINSLVRLNLVERQTIECIWTLIPAVILVQIAVPSLLLLYILDERAGRALTIKVLGHQWYWRYEYYDFYAKKPLEFDSYIETRKQARLLRVDNAPAVPIGIQTRVLVGSTDVLHAWAIPSIGVKADACPGRLNQLKFTAHRPGAFFGQCSEICGANHRFIPVKLEVGGVQEFVEWVHSQL